MGKDVVDFLKQVLPKAEFSVYDGKPAAVLIPLALLGDELHVVFIRRSRGLRYHGGEYGFPGGVREKGESAVEAALRETEEEIGVRREHVEVLGFLPPVRTLTGFTITPVVGFLALSEGFTFRLNRSEVEEVILPPLSSLVRNKFRDVFGVYFLFEGRKIWGASARILTRLIDVIDHA